MKLRPLGRSGIQVAPLAFGGNVFGWTVDEPSAFRLLDTFTGNGFNLVDTADVYSKWAPGNSGGESETVIGHWIALGGGRREKIVLATKVGMEMPGGKKGLSREYIAQAVEDSLKRLKTDRIDLYQAHAEDPATPIDETLEAFSRLVRDGKVRAIGASNFAAASLDKADQAAKAHGWPRFETAEHIGVLGSARPLLQAVMSRWTGVSVTNVTQNGSSIVLPRGLSRKSKHPANSER